MNFSIDNANIIKNMNKLFTFLQESNEYRNLYY